MQLSIEDKVSRGDIDELDRHYEESGDSVVVEKSVREEVLSYVLLALFYARHGLFGPEPPV